MKNGLFLAMEYRPDQPYNDLSAQIRSRAEEIAGARTGDTAAAEYLSVDQQAARIATHALFKLVQQDESAMEAIARGQSSS
ncbi:MAG: hypothetical protein ACREBW_06105 [Candidatus Micrarchaeaceae archaeon]